MKILLLGAEGQLGWQLRRSLSVLGELTALSRHSAVWCGNLANRPGLGETVQALRPDVIVNAAAYTAVDRAETEPQAAFEINHLACETLAREAERCGAWLVHYSTDYVFDGSGERPWRETDPTGPLNVYGQSKLAGELAIAYDCERHLILRCSWLFDTWGANFVKSILGAARQREMLDVVADQWGAPTRAALVADVTAHVLRALQPRLAGTYHLAAAGDTRRDAFAAFVLNCARQQGLPLKAGPQGVRPIASPASAGIALRPANSRLDCSLLQQTFGLRLPPWEQGVEAVVAELGAMAYKMPG